MTAASYFVLNVYLALLTPSAVDCVAVPQIVCSLVWSFKFVLVIDLNQLVS